MDEDEVMAMTGITASVVGAYLTHNKVGTAELPSLISSTYAALAKPLRPLSLKPRRQNMRRRFPCEKA